MLRIRIHPDDLSHHAAGNRGYQEITPEPYDQPFLDDAGKISSALFQRPADCKGPGKLRDFSVIRLIVLDDLVSSLFECRVDAFKEHSMPEWDFVRI